MVVTIGVITLLTIFYTLGPACLFCAVGGLMVGQLGEMVGLWDIKKDKS